MDWRNGLLVIPEIHIMRDQLVTNLNTKGNPESFIANSTDLLAKLQGENTVSVEAINNYEIYTVCPVTGTTGWEVKNIRSTDTLIKLYPHFDCVITKNDTCPDEEFLSHWKANNQ